MSERAMCEACNVEHDAVVAGGMTWVACPLVPSGEIWKIDRKLWLDALSGGTQVIRPAPPEIREPEPRSHGGNINTPEDL